MGSEEARVAIGQASNARVVFGSPPGPISAHPANHRRIDAAEQSAKKRQCFPLTGSETCEWRERELRLAQRHQRRFKFRPSMPANGGFELLRLQFRDETEVVESVVQRRRAHLPERSLGCREVLGLHCSTERHRQQSRSRDPMYSRSDPGPS